MWWIGKVDGWNIFCFIPDRPVRQLLTQMSWRWIQAVAVGWLVFLFKVNKDLRSDFLQLGWAGLWRPRLGGRLSLYLTFLFSPSNQQLSCLTSNIKIYQLFRTTNVIQRRIFTLKLNKLSTISFKPLSFYHLYKFSYN